MDATPPTMRAKPMRFLKRERLLEEERGKNSGHQWHYAGKERSGMCRRREEEARIRQQDGGCSADDQCGDAQQAQAIECQPRAYQQWGQQQPGDGEPNGGDIPCRQAGSKTEAADNDVCGPNADCSKATQRTVRIHGGGEFACRRLVH
jgi:hypothetical protein